MNENLERFQAVRLYLMIILIIYNRYFNFLFDFITVWIKKTEDDPDQNQIINQYSKDYGNCIFNSSRLHDLI